MDIQEFKLPKKFNLNELIANGSLKFIKIKDKEYAFKTARESRKFKLQGNIILLKKESNLYILNNKQLFLNDFYAECRSILKKHPSWAKWALNIKEIKDLQNIALNEKNRDPEFDLVYSMDMIPCYLNYVIELNNLITKYGSILKNHINPLKYDFNIKFERALDEIYTYIHTVQKKNFTESFFSLKHKHLITPTLIDKFDYLKTLIDKNKIQKSAISNFITKKVAIIESPNELIILTDTFINDLTGYSLNSKLKELKEDKICIVYQDADIIIAEIDCFENMRKYGSKQWCITQQEHYFHQYLSQHREVNRQFILWDFSKTVDDIYSMVGFTLNMLNEFKASHLKNDNITPLEYRNKIKSKIPKITEDVKFNIIKTRGETNSDILEDAYKYNSDQAKDWVKKMIRLSDEEDKITSTLTFLKLFNSTPKEEVDGFIKDIGLDVEKLKEVSLKRLINTENIAVLDIIYPYTSSRIQGYLENRSYVNVGYFRHVYENYLIQNNINENIINEFIGKYCFMDNSPNQMFVDKCSKKQIIDFIKKIVSESLIDDNVNFLHKLIEKISNPVLIINSVFSHIKESHLHGSFFNKDNLHKDIVNFIKFGEISNINIDAHMPSIMLIAINCKFIHELYDLLPINTIDKFKLSRQSTKDVTQSLMNKNQSYLLGAVTNIVQAIDLGWFDQSTRPFRVLMDKINTIKKED